MLSHESYVVQQQRLSTCLTGQFFAVTPDKAGSTNGFDSFQALYETLTTDHRLSLPFITQDKYYIRRVHIVQHVARQQDRGLH